MAGCQEHSATLFFSVALYHVLRRSSAVLRYLESWSEEIYFPQRPRHRYSLLASTGATGVSFSSVSTRLRTRSKPAPAPSVFISYRRQDSAAAARWLFTAIQKTFGRPCVFIDTEDVRIGDRWEKKIQAAVPTENSVWFLQGVPSGPCNNVTCLSS
jgi:TIR domain